MVGTLRFAHPTKILDSIFKQPRRHCERSEAIHLTA